MKKMFTFLGMVLMAVPFFGQSYQLSTDDQRSALGPIDRSVYEGVETEATAPGDDLPFGTITTDAVTARKIGAASNAFTFLIGENVQLSTVRATDGDAVAFIYRQNISDCGGATVDNGLYRYSISTDGGFAWNNGSAGISQSGITPVGCYGFGPINNIATKLGRYPNFLISLPGAGQTIADLKGVYVGAALDPAYPAVTDWDGMVAGLVDNAAGVNPTSVQEEYYFGNNDQYLPYHLAERVAGEYWSVSWDYDAGGSPTVGSVLKINKGLYDATTNKVNWTNAESIPLPFVKFLSDGATDSSYARTTPTIAFSPDGMTGYVAFNGDIYDRDSVYQPIWLKTSDGGLTWGDPVEVKLREFSEVRDLIQEFWIVVDTVNNDTVPSGSGAPTTGFEHDLIVDKNGNPHFICTVANGGLNNADGTTTAPNYTIYSGLRKYTLDITIDSYGDPNVLFVADQVTFRGNFGIIGAGSPDEVTADPFVQASRTEDGSKIFFSWVDSDTTGNFGSSDNNDPNLFTRGLDVDNLTMTDVTNWTGDDLTWVSRAVMPKMAPIIFDDGNGNYNLPTVIMDISPNTSAASPVSFWYFSDIDHSDAEFINPVDFFYNCKENPFVNVITPTAPGCGLSDGALSLSTSGGLGSLQYLWDASAGSSTMASVSGLSAGVYEVTVSDSLGCSETVSYTLNDANSPTLAVDSTAGITCFGDGNGYAEVTATPAMGSTVTSYLWSNGETTAIATALPQGSSTLTVTDDQNCVSITSVSIDEPSDISLSATATDAGCYGEATGSVSSLAFGGTGAISYLWDNSATTPDLSGLAAGVYSVTVTDENGCTKNASVTVSEPDSLTLALSANANGATMPPYNGFASVTYTGGSDPVTFVWTGPDGFSGSSNIVFGLNGGVYVVTATDANGCVTVDSVEVGGRVSTIGIDDELAAGISTMQIFPNPNNGAFSVHLEMDRAQDVTVEVLNLRGQVVYHHEERNALVLDRDINLADQTAGIYFVQVTTDRGTAGRKLVLR